MHGLFKCDFEFSGLFFKSIFNFKLNFKFEVIFKLKYTVEDEDGHYTYF